MAGTIPQRIDAVLHIISQSKEIPLTLLEHWVHSAVDELVPAHLHPVTVPAVILDYAIGLEPQGKLQRREEEVHHGPGALGFPPAGPAMHKRPRKRGESMQGSTGGKDSDRAEGSGWTTVLQAQFLCCG